MKNLLIAFTLLIGFVMPAHADKEVAERAIRCSALIYIELTRPEMSGLTAGEALMNRIYAYHQIDGTDTEMTNGQSMTARGEASQITREEKVFTQDDYEATIKAARERIAKAKMIEAEVQDV